MLDMESLNMMKEIVEAFGPSGFEREINGIIMKYMAGFVDDIFTDKLGSIAFKLRGDGPTILITGHTDEVGFIVSSITEEGFLTFNQLGGWWDQVLLAQRVVVRGRSGDVHGVIASKPPQILSQEERNKIVDKKNMFIDIGACNKEEVEEAGIKVGDPVVPWSPFKVMKNGRVVMAKAFDDRIGIFIFIEVIKRIKEQGIAHPNTIVGAATVQEEVGARGAKTITYLVEPDACIVLEVDIAGDVPGIKPSEALTKMGKGPGLITYDASMIPNQPFKELVILTAQQAQIPLQLSQVNGGGTDAGRIHINKQGCPCVVVTIPTRHIHSHVGILSLEDVEKTILLIIELLKRLDWKTVEEFTTYIR